MDFGARSALGTTVPGGNGAPVPDAALKLAWFERSSTEMGSAAEALAESGLLERLREANGLVYNGEGDYEF